ncbi:hypothetical protein DFH07DRAFT_465077 [Mycena maculata]|uniref:DUF4470 domain-containing protein n=1 Tax=Mycena maculata TaxID=230809 RepID=A0AAD7K9T4_9AGAR|nr:hypothetical protein DFH07DRAFT_465077 [Mycena maculata]
MSLDQPSSKVAPADALKNKGNTFFKSGNVAEASKCYAKAEKLCPTNPVYPSNLSAALFEEGDYLACIMAIDRWWKLCRPADFEENPLGPSLDSRLALRLSGRLIKALCHGVRSGVVSQQCIHDLGVTITELQRVVSLAEEVKPSGDWDRIAGEPGDWDENIAEARARLSALPIFRKTAKPILEYFTIGQDPLMSLVDDWGPEHETPLKVESMSAEEISKLSFLLGGVGDARHVYSTLVGVHRAHKKLDKKRQAAFRVHITLLDIHPAALARDLCMLLLLDQLVDTSPENSVTRAEILATLFYTFAGVVMPGYCFSRLERVMEDLRIFLKGDGPEIPSWIHVDSAAAVKITSKLDFWATVPQEYTAERALNEHTVTSPAEVLDFVKSPDISPEYRAGAQSRIDTARQEVMDVINQMNSTQLRASGLAPPPQNASAEEKRECAARRESIISHMVEIDLNNDGNMMVERFWYEKVKAFVPPPELWSRHSGMEHFKGRPSPEIFSRVRNHINKTWKPNSTLFDPNFPPNFKLNPFEAPGYIDLFNHRFGINSTTADDKPDAPCFSNFVDLFDKVSEALTSLKSQVKLEFLCGELTQELSKMRLGGDHTRPADFPRAYQRGHLSNVPDYTHGTLNAIIYALPIVHSVSSNCFLNTGIWANDEEFIHTYTLLKSADVPKYLGCEFISQEAMQGLVILRKQDLPLPLVKLASRPELITWLTRVLLYTVLPSSAQQGRFRARLPNNLVAFVSLLLHLRGVGYPGHWLSEFLQAVLSGRLVTDIAPYTDKWPIPVSDIKRRVPTRAVRLDPWTAELESIIATALQGIPFHIPLPDDFAAHHTDIGTFEAAVEASSPWMGFMMGTMVNPMPVEDPVVCLLLYKPCGLSADELLAKLPLVLNGAKSPESGTLCILTSQEVVAVPVIRWRLSKARVARMREEGWVMVAYRTDVELSFTAPVSANKWTEV